MYDAERFATGIDFASFVTTKAEDGKKYAAMFEVAKITPADIAYFSSIAEPVNIVAFSESWCPDCVNNVPVIARIAALNPNIQLRIFPRDSTDMEDYMTKGRRTIPTIVCFDGAFQEIGRWIEHPEVVRQKFAAGEDVWHSETRERYNRGEFTEEVAREIGEILRAR